MTSLEFDQLGEEQQINLLRAYGTLVAERVEGASRFYLYAVSSFYVELFHDLSQSGRIKLLGSFDDPTLLDIYLNGIDISALYSK